MNHTTHTVSDMQPCYKVLSIFIMHTLTEW